MLRSLLETTIGHSRHNVCPDRHLLRVLNGSQGFSSSQSPKRPGDRKGGKNGQASIRQNRLASEVKAIISAALQQGPCNVPLLQRCGFEIHQVKMSRDLRKAFVLWKALPGMHQTVQKELNSQGKRLRSMVFHHLNMPFSPAIEFLQDKVNPQAQAIDDILSKLDEESD
ncbi:uncharacterized protein [Physcomitrium patens]|uniref:Ribosome-binding factor A n=1 Tax=Physcomitrium patens TaxID=3218 RepID=A9RXE9_PHYPA|nr:uncharacterized protein LOC112291007 [Physcomitrium patens]XP_024393695.1 uncharacterized protein LOC112291007 [Physcomitrium patens]PNR41341.1 hypothetical protein PHYPA_018744 [Physcomitrium patens]|eukprot:XP_024393694.1 uncharacterized protein LOC112291007 [Physcomitrella patens]